MNFYNKGEIIMKKLTFKLITDAVMSILWISLMVYDFTGSLWHEILGLSLGVLMLLHICLNLNFIKTVGATLLTGKMNLNKVRLLLDVLLFGAGFLMMLTGILISKELFSFNTQNYNF